MSGPMYSGGGRRQHTGALRRQAAFCGRVLLALAAGALFGVLAWEPPARQDTPDHPDARSASKPRQQDRVTEDAAAPHLDIFREPDDPNAKDRSAQVGWLRAGGRNEGLPERALRLHPPDDHESLVGTRHNQNEGIDEVPISSLHSRGPPDEP